MSDTIIYLDMPLKLRKRRIITRFIKQQLHIEQCHYKSNLRMFKFMFKWTRDFEKNRYDYEQFLCQFSDKVIHLQRPKEAKKWLQERKTSSLNFI